MILRHSINVLPVNDAPLLTEIANSEVGEDGLFALALDVTDIDSEDLFYSVSVDNNASAYVLEGELNISPFSGYNGDIAVGLFMYLMDI